LGFKSFLSIIRKISIFSMHLYKKYTFIQQLFVRIIVIFISQGKKEFKIYIVGNTLNILFYTSRRKTYNECIYF